MATHAATLQAYLQATFTGSATFGNAAPVVTINPGDFAAALGLSQGTGVGQFDQCGVFAPAIAGAGHQDYDLTALLDPFGTSQNVAHVKAIAIYNPGAANLIVDGTVANAYAGLFNGVLTTPQVVIPAGGVLLLATGAVAGLGAVSGTSKIVRIGNPSGGSITPNVVLLGCSV